MVAPLATLVAVAAAVLSALVGRAAASLDEDGQPAYLYGDPIHVECIDRTEDGKPVLDAQQQPQWVPFPTCNETGRGLVFHYGHEGELNCTIAAVSSRLFRQLALYVHADVPLTCAVAARPWRPAERLDEPDPPPPPRVPLLVALAGRLQPPHLLVAPHLNVLLHAAPKHHLRPHDSGLLDSAVAYSTSPLAAASPLTPAAAAAPGLLVGDPLPLKLSVRWLLTPALPHTDGRLAWRGLTTPRRAVSSAVFAALAFFAGAAASAASLAWCYRRSRRGPRLPPGATPLGYGLDGGGGGGGGWGYRRPKRRD